MEDTIEAIFAGFCFFHSLRLPLQSGSGTNATLPGRVNLILDIDKASSWNFITRPGALHIILTNIVGNALKCTSEGYVSVQVKANPVISDKDGVPVRSGISVSVQDTGCGMDPGFLRNGYFTPFSQENGMLPGNGLGASITQKTIQSIHGVVEICSQKGIGTHVLISLTLDNAPEKTPFEGSLAHASDLAPTRELVRQKSIGLLGFGTSDIHISTSLSLERICREWLQMDVLLVTPSDSSFPHCDFYIALHDYLDMGNLEIKAIAPGPEARFSSPVIIICSSPRSAHSLFLAAQQRGDAEVLEFDSQPCRPRKLANSLEVCLKHQNRRISELKVPGSPMTSSLDKLKRQISPTLNTGPKSPSGLWSTSASNPINQDRDQGHTEVHKQVMSPLADEDYFSLVAPVILPSPEVGGSPAHESNAQVTPTLQPRVLFTVLLVDDNHIDISLLVALMKKLGLEYIIAQNGQEALDRFKESFSNIRIKSMDKCYTNHTLDISMPVMDGLESSRQIRAFENSLKSPAHVPIIALTGVAQAEPRRDAIGSGMNLFLTKPVRLDKIASVIDDHTGINMAFLKAGRKMSKGGRSNDETKDL
ncbi:hypothetical protein N7454_005622 [Penicillium verhagenii]|nr:hypothetical protein N7454_005622 [Penicillium verhagenii]